jgi:hypothetical protein
VNRLHPHLHTTEIEVRGIEIPAAQAFHRLNALYIVFREKSLEIFRTHGKRMEHRSSRIFSSLFYR